MAKYITLKVDDEAYELLRLHTKHTEVWLGSPTGDWSPKRAFLELIELANTPDTKPINIAFVDDEVFESIRQANEQIIGAAFQAGRASMNAESDSKEFKPTIKFIMPNSEPL